MESCPICRARLNGATVCRRCRADLEKVQAVEQHGRALTIAALKSLVEGDFDAAAQWLDRARMVHATPAVRALSDLMDAKDHRDNAALQEVVEDTPPDPVWRFDDGE